MVRKPFVALMLMVGSATISVVFLCDRASSQQQGKPSLAALSTTAKAADEPAFTRKEDVIYGRKYGTALTMDVFTPKKDVNGAAVIFVVSGGFFSSHEAIRFPQVKPFVERGYTVFAVVHGSQPRFQVPEIVQDMNRAVRFIRYHA